MGTGWRFGLLGPVEVFHGESPIEIGAAKQRALLAALLAAANRVVTIDDLIACLWETDPPAGASATLRSYVMRLRRGLGADAPIVTRPDGYLIQVEAGALDVQRFDSLVRAAGAETDPGRAAATLRDALALWRGEALSDVPSTSLRRKVVPAWEERRLLAIESRVDADLRLGRHRDLVPELAELTAAHPFREKFWARRMLALYRSGRQADALDCYRTVSELLAEQLGVDPGLELREAQRVVLTDADAPDAGPEPPPRPRRNCLPGDVADFAGRDEDMRRLLDVLDTAPEPGTAVLISAIDGMGGIGKTALAVHLAHRLADRYPDAQLFVDLRAHTAAARPLEPSVALDTLLRALGVAGDRIPAGLDDRAALWRAELAGRRLLVVLDNAATAAQVRPLLPGTAGCLALVTSRRRLTDLDTATTVSLDVLEPAAALELLSGIVGAARVSADPEAARTVVGLCGHLPLAIRIAAARLRARPAWTVGHLARRLADERRRLSELVTGDRSVAAVFALSYRDIPPERQRVFRLLGLVPGQTFDARVAAAMAGLDFHDFHHAESILEDLVDAHLLQQPQRGRYRFHDLIREYARESAAGTETEEERGLAIGRMLDYHLSVADTAATLIGASHRRLTLDLAHPPAAPEPLDDKAAALAWFAIEYPNLVFAIGYSVEHGWYGHAWQLAHTTWNYAYLCGHITEWISTHEQALIAAERLGDKVAEAATLVHLASGYDQAGRFDDAMALDHRALALYREIGDTAGEANCLNNLALCYQQVGRYQEALDQHLRARELRRAAGDRWNEGHSFYNLGVVYDRLGRYADAIEHFGLARERYREFGDQRVDAMVVNSIGVTYRKLGRIDEALDHLDRSLRMNRETASRTAEIETLNDLGDTWLAAGQPRRAVELHRESLVLNREVGDRYQEGHSHQGIARALEPIDPAAAREHWLTALRIYTAVGVPEADAVRDHLKDVPLGDSTPASGA